MGRCCSDMHFVSIPSWVVIQALSFSMEVQNPFQITWDKTSYPSFTEYFFNKIAVHGSNLAIADIDTGKQWRFSEIRGWCDMCTTRLKELQVNQNSRVAVVTGTTGQAIFVHLACSLIGCSAVAVNGFNTVDEIWQLVDLSEATHIIVEQQFMQKADDVRRKAQMRGGGRIKHVRVIDDVLTAETINSDRRRKYPLVKEQSSASLIKSEPEDFAVELKSPISEISAPIKENGLDESEAPSDPSMANISVNSGANPMLIFFTSGTTGLPKAAELTHKSMIINIQQMSLPLYGPLIPKERFLLPLSISHIFGAISAYYALVNGASVYMTSKISPKSFIDILINNQINVCHVNPAIVLALALDPSTEHVKVPQLRSMLCGGAPLDVNLASVVKERLALKDFRQTYGMTELGGLCTLASYEHEQLDTVGAPLPGMLFKIVNWETKQICPPRKPGQLLVCGPQVMPSYFKNPKATSELLDATGYVKTGDAAFYDESGRIYVLDRIKDIIKCKGTLICPSEVELVLRTHPGIDDCAVVGRQDHVAGEVPAAFVMKSSSHPLLASAEVRQWVSGKIATFKELRGGVFFISEIPRSVCGKVLRRHLRQFWDRERTTTKGETASKEGKAPIAVAAKTPTKKTNGVTTPKKKMSLPLSKR